MLWLHPHSLEMQPVARAEIAAYYAERVPSLKPATTNKILSAAEQDQLTKQFNDVESSIGPDVQQRFEELAEKLQHRAFHE